jgi:choline dehydrogenase-like flavoprotein
VSSELEEKHAVIIGSGFGGAVFACRLGEAFGRRDFDICLLERGRRYAPGDFPRLRWPDYLSEDPLHRTSRRVPDAARLLWGVDQGLVDFRNLGALQCVQAAGYGGGSLIYANVQLQPPASVFESWPKEYQGEHALSAEFELAAQYLDARPLPPALRDRVPKARAMRAAAEKLGRTFREENDSDFFYPPLAIRFGPAGKNRFGREQGSCNSCGNCIAGCPERAKNTLDLNYLACAEQCGVEVRTLSEVLHLEQRDERYVVVYFDHIEGRQRRILTAHVFLAAGAVGSTELLLRSRSHLRPREAGAPTGLDRLGERFFANGDSLGVVFDCAEAAQAGEGPTITTALLHAEPLRPVHEARGQAAPHKQTHGERSLDSARVPSSPDPEPDPQLTWFLIQDGGIPTSFERLLGAFRSPLLLGRNRLTAASPRSGGSAPAASRGPANTLVDLALAAAGLARHLAARDDEPPLVHAFPSAWTELLPRPLRSVADRLAGASDTARARMLELDARVLERMGPATLFLSRLVKPEQVLEQVADVTSELYPLLRHLFQKQRGFELTLSLLTHLLIARATPERTLVLLAMGPDQQGQLSLERGKLKMVWQEGANLALFGLQERLMRDLAVQLGGELRSNPAFTLSRKAVSVHSQGGCGMGAPGESVTDPDGQVHGFPNLYVVDAAAFPASVGVNPSATIVAVAERKAARFVRAHRARRAFPRAGTPRRLPLVTPPPTVLGTSQRPLSTPLRVAPTAAVLSRPIGLWWKERMEGSFSALECPALRGALDVTGFEASERRGREQGARIVAELAVVIDDVDLFLRSFRARVGKQKVEARVSGKVTIEFSRGVARRVRTYHVRPEHGLLEFIQGDAQAPNAEIDTVSGAQAQPQERERARDLLGLRYALTLDPDDGVEGALILHGRKVFQDDPGHDVWPDVTTLFFTLQESKPARARSGVVRVGLRDFLEVQLPSMDTFMEGEPARDPRADAALGEWQSIYKPAESARLWALLRFFGAVSWGIKDVYARWF